MGSGIRSVLGAAIALMFMLGSAWAADWRQVSSGNANLWYDNTSLYVDDDDFLNIKVYRGSWAGADTMSSNAISVSVDCWDGYFEIWNTYTEKWEDAPSDLESALNDLAWDACDF